jgi:hypothetical protein
MALGANPWVAGGMAGVGLLGGLASQRVAQRQRAAAAHQAGLMQQSAVYSAQANQEQQSYANAAAGVRAALLGH